MSVSADFKGALPSEEKAEVHQTETLKNTDLMNDAFDGETREHEMGVWESVKAHPWACLWAFIMCFTIVSRSILPAFRTYPLMSIAPIRSWSPSTCS